MYALHIFILYKTTLLLLCLMSQINIFLHKGLKHMPNFQTFIISHVKVSVFGVLAIFGSLFLFLIILIYTLILLLLIMSIPNQIEQPQSPFYNHTKITMYKLNLSSDLNLSKTRSSLRKTHSRYNSALETGNKQHLPNLTIISRVLQVDQAIWSKRKDSLSNNHRQLYEILEEQRRRKQKRNKLNASKVSKDNCNNYHYFTEHLQKPLSSKQKKAI